MGVSLKIMRFQLLYVFTVINKTSLVISQCYYYYVSFLYLAYIEQTERSERFSCVRRRECPALGYPWAENKTGVFGAKRTWREPPLRM